MNAVECAESRSGSEAVVEVACDAHPQKGGVQQCNELLDSEVLHSADNSTFAVQQSAPLLDELVENGAVGGAVTELIPITYQSVKREPVAADSLGLPVPARMGKAGRKPTITPAVAEQLCMLMSIGFSRRQAAAYLGFAPTTITHAVARDPSLGEELRRAEELSGLQPELTLMAEARKNWRAAAWYLEFKAKHPRPLSEEEKEEVHRARLEDDRRSAEAMNSYLDHATGRAQASACEKRPARKPRGKKGAKG